MEDGKAEIPLNVTVQGDVLVVIYHARSTLGGRLQAKVKQLYHTFFSRCVYIIVLADCVYIHMASTNTSTEDVSLIAFQMASMKMFQIQFHTGFVPRNATTVKFAK